MRDARERLSPAAARGHALASGLEWVLRGAPDVVLILDADCELNSNALLALDAMFAAGAEAVQAAVRARNADGGAAGFVSAVGAAFDDATAAGWDRLGFSVPLRGTGMAFRCALLERVPWRAFGLVEDAEYGTQLKAAGVRVRYCGGAEVASEAPPSVAALCRQRRRWRGAGLLASKPLVLAHLVLALTVGFACEFVLWPAALAAGFASLYLRAVLAVGFTRLPASGLLLQALPVVVFRIGSVAARGPGGSKRRVGPHPARPPRGVRRRMRFARRTRWLKQAAWYLTGCQSRATPHPLPHRSRSGQKDSAPVSSSPSTTDRTPNTRPRY